MLKVLAKKTEGYNYKYTELSEIVGAMAELGLDYYQYTETDERTLKDYIWTVIIEDGKERKALRGAEVVKATLKNNNPAQEMGSSITYARRYSLLMALGWATADDDGAMLTRKGTEGGANSEEYNIAIELEKEEIKNEIISMGIKEENLEKTCEKIYKKSFLKLTLTETRNLKAYVEKQIKNREEAKNE